MIITIDLLSPKNQTAIALSTPKITIALSKKTGVRYSTKIKQRSHLKPHLTQIENPEI
jgi:hypothetical protein